MMNIKKAAIPFAAFALTLIPFTALASTKTSITSVDISVDNSLEFGESNTDVEATTSSSYYDVYSVSVTNVPSDGWEDGDNPKLTIKLELEDPDDYKWAVTKSSVDITDTNGTGTVSSVSNGSNYLTITYVMADLDDSDESYDLDISDTDWDESNGIASWEEAEDAKKYEVRLYRGSTLLTTVTTTDNEYNFANYFTQDGTYKFKVRGVYSSSHKGSFETSDDLDVTSSEAASIKSTYTGSTSSSSTSSGSGSPAAAISTSTGGAGSAVTTVGQWIKDSSGWWYKNADGSWPAATWQFINSKWYYFNQSGYMATGWVKWNSNWYYCGADGAMYQNATTLDGYYVNASGVWVAA